VGNQLEQHSDAGWNPLWLILYEAVVPLKLRLLGSVGKACEE
jgi:hypothetical protein